MADSEIPGPVTDGVRRLDEAKPGVKHTGNPRTAPGPSMAWAACVDCGKFGPWGDGKYRYCQKHVPHDLRYLAKTREAEAKR